jgi:hypothetical protein
MVFPADGSPHEGAVFLIRRADVEQVWVLIRWDSEARCADYVHVTSGHDVTEIRISVSGPEQGPAHVDVTYTWTGLSEAGNAFVDEQSEESFDTWMGEWEEEMAHYLRTGTKLERQ